MKKATTQIVLVASVALMAGCASDAGNSLRKSNENIVSKKEAIKQETANKDAANKKSVVIEDWQNYKGDWSLEVAENEELYLLTALQDYFGLTGIDIVEIDNNTVKGSVYSVQGAPSYRQATVDFKGEIIDGKLSAAYKDENWLYSGKLELTFKNGRIAAIITRDKVEDAPMWGIPVGKLTFVRPTETKDVNMSEKEKRKLERYLAPASKEGIEPFDKGELTDEMIIEFVGINLGAGFLDAGEFGDKVKDKGEQIVFEKSVMNDLANRYFGAKVKKHESHEPVKYENGVYMVPALGGVSKHPSVQMLMKDSDNKGTYYAVTDYISQNPEEGNTLEYEYLIELQRKSDSSYAIQAIKEIKNPIDFEALRQVRKN